jgi:putative oxidoreductase
MDKIIGLVSNTHFYLDKVGEFLPQLGLRLLLAYEFWEAGVQKFTGENWFAGIQEEFPFPFNLLPVGLSWFLATWTELLGSIALLLGLGTRFFAFAFIVLDLVAWYSVHAAHGYNVCSNGFKLPLMYLIMLLPLLFMGAGKASLDFFIKQKLVRA